VRNDFLTGYFMLPLMRRANLPVYKVAAIY